MVPPQPQLPGQPDLQCPAVMTLINCPHSTRCCGHYLTIKAASSQSPRAAGSPPPLPPPPQLFSGSVWLRGCVLEEDYLLG